MESSRKPRNKGIKFSKLGYNSIEHLLTFLTIDELINSLRISSYFNCCTKRITLLGDLKNVISYLIDFSTKNRSPFENKSSEILKINLNKKKDENLVQFEQPSNENQLETNKVIFESLNVIDLIQSDGKYIKNIVSKLKLNNANSVAIFGYLIEKLIKKGSLAEYPILNSKQEEKNNKINKSVLTAVKDKKTINMVNLKASEKSNAAKKAKMPLGKIEFKEKEFLLTKYPIGEGLIYLSRAFLFFNDIIKLDLSENNLGPKSISSLAKAIKFNFRLKTLILKNNKMSNLGCKSLFTNLNFKAEQTSLFLIDISNNDIGSDGVEALSEFLKKTKTLVNLDLAQNLIGTLGSYILKDGFILNKTIQILNFAFNGLCAEGLNNLKGYFANSKNIQTLNIGGNYLLDQGCKYMSDIIRANNTMSSLFLEWSDINSDGIRAIAQALNMNKTISYLDLSNNSLDKKTLEDFFDSLKPQLTSLDNLSLGFNQFGIDGIKKINEFMKLNQTITQLNLEKNFIGPHEGSKLILDFLISSKTLKNLNVSGCSIGSGLVYISEAFIDNKTHLENINLSCNNLESTEIEVLCKALTTNNVLFNLQLNNNSIDDRGAEAFAEALKVNMTISTINLEQNTMSSKGAKLILKSIQ